MQFEFSVSPPYRLEAVNWEDAPTLGKLAEVGVGVEAEAAGDGADADWRMLDG
jgi:hypothetical protein